MSVLGDGRGPPEAKDPASCALPLRAEHQAPGSDPSTLLRFHMVAASSHVQSQRSRPWLRSCALLSALALSLGALAAPADATHTAEHVVPAFGVGALRAESLADFPVGLDDLSRLGQARIGLYRARFREDQVLGDGSSTNWSQLDNLARAAALNGVALQPVLINMPLEAYAPPDTEAERVRFGEFAAAAARRYGPDGWFWQTCGCPKLPATVWEVWNEPNIVPFWDLPDPEEYGALLKATATALRAADPAARVLFGGLAYPSTLNTTRLAPNAFLRDVIAAVGADQFDALALHSYRPDPERAVDTLIAGSVETLRSYAGTTADGAPRKQVWVNELGRPTAVDDPNTSEDEQAISEAVQRAWLDTFLDLLLTHRADWNLGPTMWYSLRDAHTPTASWERQGLRRTTSDDADGGAKPSWDAYTGRSAAAELLYLPGLHELNVDLIGAGDGTVVSSQAGIDCGATCSGSYAAGSRVTLTAAPADGSSFAGWSDDCSGTGPCILTLDVARSVRAEFALVPDATSVPATGSSTPATEPDASPDGTTDDIAPAITRIALSPVAFRAARSGPALAALIGTRLSLALSEPATVSFRVVRLVPGRRIRGHCRRPTARGTGAPRCARPTVLPGRIARNLPAGPATLRYRGRLAGRALRPGRYRLRIRAHDAADNHSSQRTVTFVILD